MDPLQALDFTVAPRPPACWPSPARTPAQLQRIAGLRGARARPRQARALALPAHPGRRPPASLGDLLAARSRERNPEAAAAVVDKDRQRFSHAPLVIAVIARLTPGHKVPEQEQLLSGGAVCLPCCRLPRPWASARSG